MNSKKLGSDRMKLKGFTLVELIIVIAILVILAGISSIAISGFQRDARIETNNEMAKLVFSGVQNNMIQCEIENDVSSLNKDGTDKFTADKASVLVFYVDEGILANKIMIGDSDSALTDFDSTTDEYKEIKKVIDGFSLKLATGTYYVYMDLDDFLVDTVLFLEKTDYTKAATDLTSLKTGSYAITSCGHGQTFKSYSEQKESSDMLGIYTGVYPFKNSMS